MPPRRALGPRDKRLQSHRCQNCRRARTKCDGARPCSTCRSRRVQCTEAAAAAPRPAFLHYLPGPSSHFSNDDSASIEAFFAFVGPDPHSPVSLPFTPAAIRHHLLCPGPGKPGVPYTDSFMGTRRGLHAMLNSAPTDHSAHLLFGLLFSIFEMLFEPTGFGFFSVMDTISDQIDSYYTLVDNRLLVLYNWFNARRALDTNDDPRPVPVSAPVVLLPHPCALHRRAGASIVTSALAAAAALSRFRTASTTTSPPPPPQSFSSLHPAHRHWARLSLASPFAAAPWRRYPETEVLLALADDDDDDGDDALRALAAVEARPRVGGGGIDAFALLPLLRGVALEVRDEGVRARVMAALEALGARGWAVAAPCMEDLRFLRGLGELG
ncbi:Transcription factor [Neofusicoccum parvum]|uniref:Transcription factor n=1 Tax=Neofusicoccum parvum TaxID=310453 RepID=A0ACB5S656_9PEZI|nr:Transcription factor [Neofusicoccum parvum]